MSRHFERTRENRFSTEHWLFQIFTHISFSSVSYRIRPAIIIYCHGVKHTLDTFTSWQHIVVNKRWRLTWISIAFFSDSKSLQTSEDNNNCYLRLVAMEMQSDLVLHDGDFECAVCLCTYDNNGVVLRDCLHVFCRYENAINLQPAPLFSNARHRIL